VTKFSAIFPSRVLSLVLIDWSPWPDGKPTKGVSRIGRVFNLRFDSFDQAVDLMHKANPRRSR